MSPKRQKPTIVAGFATGSPQALLIHAMATKEACGSLPRFLEEIGGSLAIVHKWLPENNPDQNVTKIVIAKRLRVVF